MIAVRYLLLSLGVAGFTALVYAFVRRTRNLETRQFDKDLSTWEFKSGNLAPSETLVAPGSVTITDTNKRSK